MKCYSFENIISDYLDNSISHSMKIEAEKHLNECPNCRAKLNDMEQILESLHSLPKLKTSANFNEKLMEKIEYHKSKKKFIFKQFVYKYSQPLSTAVAVIILLFGVYYIYNSVSPNMPNQKISTSEIQKNMLNPTQLSQPTNNKINNLQKKPQYAKNQNDDSDSSVTNKDPKPNFKNKIKMVNKEK
ncbi:MAG: zf-HC2 domain-containing protein [Candidatus Marinimicrobia bacterium]|nr:zf-HC2 domain-containing protein [Candidatus Neomarinimicrobiota bacterium]